MLWRLLLLFTLLPLTEVALLIQVDRLIGLPGTIALIFATGTLGALFARREGLRTLAAFQSGGGLAAGPSIALIDGVLVLLAGAVLLTPGLITDAAGFLLLVPTIRRRVAVELHDRGKRRLKDAAKRKVDQFATRAREAASREDAIDVEFEVKDPTALPR